MQSIDFDFSSFSIHLPPSRAPHRSVSDSELAQLASSLDPEGSGIVLLTDFLNKVAKADPVRAWFAWQMDNLISLQGLVRQTSSSDLAEFP